MPRKKAEKPPKTKRQKVVKPAKRADVPAQYTRQGNIVCGRCLSRPSVRMRVEYDLAGKWGYAMRHHPDGLTLNGTRFDVQVTLYPCSNPECFTNVLVYNEAGKPGKEGMEALKAGCALRESEQLRFDRGWTDAGGVWHATNELEHSRS